MMDYNSQSLFETSALETVQEPVPPVREEEIKNGFRMQRMEVFNWGTFNEKIWTLELNGENTLLTGDIGSGKSTLVDAITTLFIAPNKAAYNKAAGADKKERDLRSYVEGHYKSSRNDLGGNARPVSLRGKKSYTVILGVFHNSDFDITVSLAQVFWLKDSAGQPERFYCVGKRNLSIKEDFGLQGQDLPSLKKRLRKIDVDVFDSFPKYSGCFRASLGIKDEQALSLFHQTISMKSVGNLTEFVRTHMLEAHDNQKEIEGIIQHFDDLNRAHEAVQKAKKQIEMLQPIVADCHKYREIIEEEDRLTKARDALRSFFAELKVEFLRERLEKNSLLLEQQKEKVEVFRSRIIEKERTRDGIKQSINENGGGRIEQINSYIEEKERERSRRLEKFKKYSDRISSIKKSASDNAEKFILQRNELENLKLEKEGEQDKHENQLNELSFGKRGFDVRHKSVDDEIRDLSRRESNIPSKQIAIREGICRELNIEESKLPFVGELLQVSRKHLEWQGAIERLLHSFALSLLVPQAHYKRVADYVDRTNLKGKLVYYKISGNQISNQSFMLHPKSVAKRIDIKPDSLFVDWLECEVKKRFDYGCCDTADEFYRAEKAITKNGQIKSKGNRHEKDDRSDIHDRSNYVLGWSNKDKIAALKVTRNELESKILSLLKEMGELDQTRRELKKENDTIIQLLEISTYREIDYQSIVLEINALQKEKLELESSSDKLRELRLELEKVINDLKDMNDALGKSNQELWETNKCIEDDTAHIENQQTRISSEPNFTQETREYLLSIRQISQKHRSLNAFDNEEDSNRKFLQNELDKNRKRSDILRTRITNSMKDFNSVYRIETQEMDASLDAADEYEKMLQSIMNDDLPRFENEFKDSLNQNTIRDIVMFRSNLEQASGRIKDNIELINNSLKTIDYNKNPRRYIIIQSNHTVDTEIRDFRRDLKKCTEGSVNPEDNDQYSEEKFLQVKELIERFRGREAYSSDDKKWRAKVTDVRNWHEFSASVRFAADDTEDESLSDSNGKSGGQKEKLAYTILAASLAYQFGLSWQHERSKMFHFVVIDEAFGRGSDESTSYGLELFKQLDLQLLTITPLQKIQVIEPYVKNVGIVSNINDKDSQLLNLSIEEYRKMKEKKVSQ